jgi:hypothetical protein
MITPVGPGEFGLVLRTHGADHGCPEVLGPLGNDETDTSGGSMDQDGIPSLDLEAAMEDISPSSRAASFPLPGRGNVCRKPHEAMAGNHPRFSA